MLELEPDLNSVAEILLRGTIDRVSSTVAQAVKIRTINNHVNEGDLCRRIAKGLRFILVEKARTSIMSGFHDEIGHWSFATTYKIISGRFWCPKIRVCVAPFVRGCDSCQNANPSEQNEPYWRMPVSGFFYTVLGRSILQVR